MMLGLARYAMRGPFQAALLAATTLLLSLVMPPLAWLSGALVALVILRRGPAMGLRSAAIGVAAAAGFSFAALGQPLQALIMASMFWLPVGLLATLLRSSIRLDWTLCAAASAALLLVLGIFVAMGDPAAFWLQAFTVLPMDAVAQQAGIPAESLQTVLAGMARLMTGALAATVLISALLSLLLARSWQAGLYNPGGFASEFRELRLGRIAAALATVICALAFVTHGDLVVNLAVVVLSLYVIQGLALLHGVVAIRAMGKGWLFALYVLLLFLMPQMTLLLGALGMADAWIDLRGRMAQNAS